MAVVLSSTEKGYAKAQVLVGQLGTRTGHDLWCLPKIRPTNNTDHCYWITDSPARQHRNPDADAGSANPITPLSPQYCALRNSRRSSWS